MNDAEDITVRLPAQLAGQLDMVAEQFDVPRDQAATLLIAAGLVCRAQHSDFEADLGVAELLAALEGGGDEGRLRTLGSIAREWPHRD